MSAGQVAAFRKLEEPVERVFPSIETNYFNGGALQTEVEGDVVEGAIVGLFVWPASFEYSVMRFMRRAMTTVGFPVKKQTRLQSVSAGDRAIRSCFELGR